MKQQQPNIIDSLLDPPVMKVRRRKKKSTPSPQDSGEAAANSIGDGARPPFEGERRKEDTNIFPPSLHLPHSYSLYMPLFHRYIGVCSSG